MSRKLKSWNHILSMVQASILIKLDQLAICFFIVLCIAKQTFAFEEGYEIIFGFRFLSMFCFTFHFFDQVGDVFFLRDAGLLVLP